ncbi:hypothetical protein M0812_07878 [Anaeramoeba flamelloides]|uniref:Uncharacterized protein n=1 Tax=Anaeramoeba flamelloides TaxID=1746091 RepID=A0AAV8A2U6_9EUKA|nr:hypothetical protein M0812_07878 [Anaeramoeba flamelloides]
MLLSHLSQIFIRPYGMSYSNYDSSDDHEEYEEYLDETCQGCLHPIGDCCCNADSDENEDWGSYNDYQDN